MALFFKEHRARSPDERLQCWISQDGCVAVLVRFSRGVDRAAFVGILDEVRSEVDALNVSDTLDMVQYAAADAGDCESICALAGDGDHVYWVTKGEVTLISVSGRQPEVIADTQGKRALVPGAYFLLLQGSVEPRQVARMALKLEQESATFLQQSLDEVSAGHPWQALVFPIESTVTWRDPQWPYNPFVGFQESQPHERLGLRLLADSLFKRKDYSGFRIIGGHHVALKRGSRLLDGILVSPWGVHLLELKHVAGEVTLEPQNRNTGMRILKGGGVRTDTNPVFKIEEALRQTLAGLDLGADVPPFLRKGILLFTHPRAHVRCLDPSGQAAAIPLTVGNVMIGTPASIAAEIVDQIRNTEGGRRAAPTTAPIDRETLNRIVHRLGKSYEPPAAAGTSSGARQFGRFLVDGVAIESESNEHVTVFPARIEGKSTALWAKRFLLCSIGKGESLDDEVARVGREVTALQDLSREPGIQRYWDRFVDGLHLYVLVDRPSGVPLDEWLQQSPPTNRRIEVLLTLARVLCALAVEGVVHRALRPFNVRIDAQDQTTLINFDLCQIGSSATVDAASRLRLDAAFLSREALTPGAKLGPADDVYSFGKLVCTALCGRQPFGSPMEQMRFVAKPANWAAFAAEVGLDPVILADIQAMVALDPARRPVGELLVERVSAWPKP